MSREDHGQMRSQLGKRCAVCRECSTHENDPETRVPKRRKPLAGRLLVDGAGRLTVDMRVAAAGWEPVGGAWTPGSERSPALQVQGRRSGGLGGLRDRDHQHNRHGIASVKLREKRMISGASFIRGSYARLFRALRFVKRLGRLHIIEICMDPHLSRVDQDRSVAATRPQ